ncbi:hypothetical protein [Alkaliflexus imshenetskii]|uniref:hypothetical protein n=1 Tax=Alkaliflexus imshenetskii TaxID=286730 RepID=UPI0004792F2E|nr:hypothetical protein [Alkaliflexus imshenetskii]
MKKLKYFLAAQVGLVMLLLVACGEDLYKWDTVIYEAPELSVSASAVSISWDESITYTDNSTKVHARKWTFQGGTPATSTEQEVTVTYPVGGSYNTILELTFVDGSKKMEVFAIEVERDPATIKPEYEYGATLGLFTEDVEITQSGFTTVALNMNQFPGTLITDTYEGVKAYRFEATGASDWAMGALNYGGQSVDISAFADGYYHVALRSASQAAILIRIRSTGGGNAILTFTAEGEEYGFKRDGEWHHITIPIADIVAADAARNLRLGEITDFLLFRSTTLPDGTGGDVRNWDPYVFDVDHVFVSEKFDLK